MYLLFTDLLERCRWSRRNIEYKTVDSVSRIEPYVTLRINSWRACLHAYVCAMRDIHI